MSSPPLLRTVLFADLRGSTALFSSLGNAGAAGLLAHTIGLLSHRAEECGGKVVKTLGDGLMAVFGRPSAGVEAMQALLESTGRINASAGAQAPKLQLQLSLDLGEIVEVGGDCFGDAVNAAARLLEHAGDNEALITRAVYERLSPAWQRRFRSLGPLHLRGRTRPCHVFQFAPQPLPDGAPITGFARLTALARDSQIRLRAGTIEGRFNVDDTPFVLGRSAACGFCIPEYWVSRSHARIEWHGGHFHLWDHSSNGSFVAFADGSEIALHRARCSLHGSGVIGLGATTSEQPATRVYFDILTAAEAAAVGCA